MFTQMTTAAQAGPFNLPLRLGTALRGYIRVGSQRVRCKWSSTPSPDRFVLYLQGYSALQKALEHSTLKQQLHKDLVSAVQHLCDEEMNSLEELLTNGAQQQQEQQPSPWLTHVGVRPVRSGHRAYNSERAAGEQMREVIARRSFSPGGFIGLYMGYVLDEDDAKRALEGTVADRRFHKYV